MGMLMPDNKPGPMRSPKGHRGSKRPMPMDMRQATHVAFTDDTFVEELQAALVDRDSRLCAMAKSAKIRQNQILSRPTLTRHPHPTNETEERLWAKEALEAPMRVLPHEEASFRAFVVRAQVWMKNAGIVGELTHEAAMRAWLAAAEAAKQRVIAGGGCVENHPHLLRFWSARDSEANGGVKTGLEDEKHGCSTSCLTDSDLCAPCVLPDPHHVFGDIDNITIPIPVTPDTSRAGRISCSACRAILEAAMKHAEIAKENKSEEQRTKSQAMIEEVVREYA